MNHPNSPDWDPNQPPGSRMWLRVYRVDARGTHVVKALEEWICSARTPDQGKFLPCECPRCGPGSIRP
ncbi:hypothetical protein ABIA38_001613 [Embleya sp. AB8]